MIKARKKLEDRYYAIKKVRLAGGDNPRVKEIRQKILREVRVWPSLYHENIVRYYTCWQETEFVKTQTTTSQTLTSEKISVEAEVGDEQNSERVFSSESETESSSSYSDDTTENSWSKSFSKKPSNLPKVQLPKSRFFKERDTSSESESETGEIPIINIKNDSTDDIIFQRANGDSYSLFDTNNSFTIGIYP